MPRRSETVSRRYASLSDAAEYIGVNERTIRRHIADGSLTGYRLGSRLVRVDLNELEQALRPIPTVGSGGAA
jgi:excisionase family DNA binding protein